MATRCSSCGSRERMGVRECRKRPAVAEGGAAVAERGAPVALVSVMRSVPVGRHVGGRFSGGVEDIRCSTTGRQQGYGEQHIVRPREVEPELHSF